jgi:hypothetical protein
MSWNRKPANIWQLKLIPGLALWLSLTKAPLLGDNNRMGSRVFDFLTESFLFRNDLISDRFASVPLAEIERELDRYRDFCLANQAAFMDEVDRTSTVAFYDPEPIDVPTLTQAALYIDQYVLQDPLLKLTEKPSESAKMLAAGPVYPPSMDGSLDLRELARILKTMKALTPMVAANFLKFVPSSLALETPAEIPIYVSDNAFEDALPAEILRFFKESARLSTAVLESNGNYRLQKLRPSRRIDIQFKGDLEGRGHGYTLRRIEDTVIKDAAAHELTVTLSLPDTPPPETEFRRWVQQSVNLAARNLFHELYSGAVLAANLGVAYGTRSELRFRALRLAMKPDTSIPIRTANAFINLDLPFINYLDIEHVMRIRREEGEAFDNFRRALDFKLSSLQEASDLQSAQKSASDAVRELTEVQLREVELKMRSIREKLGYSAVAGLVVGLAAAVQQQGFSLLSAAAAAIPIGNAVLDYRKDVKRHPAFFLWKALAKRTNQSRDTRGRNFRKT